MKILQRLKAVLPPLLAAMMLVGCITRNPAGGFTLDLNPGLITRVEDLPPGTEVRNDDWILSPVMGDVFKGAAQNPTLNARQQRTWNNLAEATRTANVQAAEGATIVQVENPKNRDSPDAPPIKIVEPKYLVPGELNVYPGIWQDADHNGRMELHEFKEQWDFEEQQRGVVVGIFNGQGSAFGVQYHIRRESDGKTFINGNHWMGLYGKKDFIQVVLIAPEFLIPGEYLVACEQDHRPIGSMKFRVWPK